MCLMRNAYVCFLLPLAAAGLLAGKGEVPVNDSVQTQEAVPSTREVATMATRFAPAEIRADLTALPANERRALGNPVEAQHHDGAPWRLRHPRPRDVHAPDP